MNKHLVEATNSHGMVVRSIEPRPANGFGAADIVTIEGSQYRIDFTTNVLHGTNYFQIIRVHDLYKDRRYTAHRYFTKFIKLIAEINGETHIKLQEENK